MKKVKAAWLRDRRGLQLGHEEKSRLTNLRFADDVMVVARTLPQLTKMLSDIHKVAGDCGLQLHPDKTKILTNAVKKTGRGNVRFIDVADLKIEILLASDSVKYLGRKISFENADGIELGNRTRAAWAKFMSNKQELTSRSYSLKDRLRLLDAIVSPTLLYGCPAWTLTSQQEQTLTTTQRKMLRMVLGDRRRKITNTTPETLHGDTSSGSDVSSNPPQEDDPRAGSEEDEDLESWVDWIRRVTHEAERQMTSLKIESWVVKARRMKWKWARRVIEEMPVERWASRSLSWDPELCFDGWISKAKRKQGRPRTRWTDAFVDYAEKLYGARPQWTELKSHIEFWRKNEDEFANNKIATVAL